MAKRHSQIDNIRLSEYNCTKHMLGRMSEWHSESHRFDPDRLHHAESSKNQWFSELSVVHGYVNRLLVRSLRLGASNEFSLDLFWKHQISTSIPSYDVNHIAVHRFSKYALYTVISGGEMLLGRSSIGNHRSSATSASCNDGVPDQSRQV